MLFVSCIGLVSINGMLLKKFILHTMFKFVMVLVQTLSVYCVCLISSVTKDTRSIVKVFFFFHHGKSLLINY